MDLSMNFNPEDEPGAPCQRLSENPGYDSIPPKCYYERIRRFLADYTPSQQKMFHFHLSCVTVFVRTVFVPGHSWKGALSILEAARLVAL